MGWVVGRNWRELSVSFAVCVSMVSLPFVSLQVGTSAYRTIAHAKQCLISDLREQYEHF